MSGDAALRAVLTEWLAGTPEQQLHARNRLALLDGGTLPEPALPPVPSRADMARVSACPHRRKPDCGCGGWLCSLGKGDRRPGETTGVVTVYQCLSCLGPP